MKLVCPKCIGLTDQNVYSGTSMLRCTNCNKVSATNTFEAYPFAELLFQVPGGSSAKVKRDNSGTIKISIKQKGSRPGRNFLLAMAMLLPIGFILFLILKFNGILTDIPVPLILYSPLWLYFMVLVINLLVEKQVITIGKTFITISKQRFFPSETNKYVISSVKEIRYKPYFPRTAGDKLSHFGISVPGKNGSEDDRPFLPAIVDSDERIYTYFFEEASDIEQVWMIGLLNWVYRRTA
ncbi:MAG TPA: hypothetical protein VK154_14095 [Chitinophagales bacterium]|nr:hypothetical protein [Chitinophagales bacterium]